MVILTHRQNAFLFSRSLRELGGQKYVIEHKTHTYVLMFSKRFFPYNVVFAAVTIISCGGLLSYLTSLRHGMA